MFQKKVLVAAGLLAVAAVAQAQVKVYGTVDMSVVSLKQAGDTKSTTLVHSGAMTTSYIGFAGSENLGGGLKAEFALETFIAADTGEEIRNYADGFWSRASNVALSGGFGKVAIGQYDNAFFTYGLTYNPFGASMVFSPTMRHYYGVAGGGNVNGNLGFDTGWVNSITYETPDMAGFTANVQWSAKENTASNAKDSWTLGAQYNAGPLSVAAAYASSGRNTSSGAFARQKDYLVAGSYDFGVAKGFAQYTSVKNLDNADVTVDNTKIYQIGVTVPVSAQGAVMASYGQAKYQAVGNPASVKNKVFSLAYDHVLSKRTDVYVGLVSERETNLKSGTSYGVGLRHNF